LVITGYFDQLEKVSKINKSQLKIGLRDTKPFKRIAFECESGSVRVELKLRLTLQIKSKDPGIVDLNNDKKSKDINIEMLCEFQKSMKEFSVINVIHKSYKDSWLRINKLKFSKKPLLKEKNKILDFVDEMIITFDDKHKMRERSSVLFRTIFYGCDDVKAKGYPAIETIELNRIKKVNTSQYLLKWGNLTPRTVRGSHVMCGALRTVCITGIIKGSPHPC